MIFQIYSIRDLPPTSRRVGNAANSIGVKASCVFAASIVSSDETKLNAIKGIFSMIAAKKALKDRILPKGYQSSMIRTAGRLTAIGLLNKARMKNTNDKR